MENKKRKFDEYDIAAFIAKARFEEKHPKEKQPEWLEKYIMVTGEKVGKTKWVIKRILYYKIQLKQNQHWRISRKGNPLLIESNPITGKEYVVLGGGTSTDVRILFETEVDVSNGTAIVLTDIDLDFLNENDYQLQRI